MTPISDIGEFALIDRIAKDVPALHPSTLRGIGDDAAVLRYGDSALLVSTDSYVEGVHFDLSYAPPMHLGYKCIAGAVSDIYAMNGQPRQVLVALALGSRFTLEFVEELYKGMAAACRYYEVDLVGGDTTSSRGALVVNVTAIGEAAPEEVVYRSGASDNEILVVTGDLGGAFMGLQLLEREKRVFLANPQMQPELEGYDYILRRQLRPEARKDIIGILRDLKIQPTSMIDISDGLSSEALHLCKQSGLGCVIYEEKIPIDQMTFDTARDLNLDPTLTALNGGEDYELLFTIRQEDYEKIQHHPDFTAIGYMHEADRGSVMVTKGGGTHPLQAQGWKHF